MILLQDYITKFPEERVKKLKIEKIIITSNLNNKKYSNIYKTKTNTSNKMNENLLERYYLYKNIFLQTPKIIKANQSVANWNIRKGMENGVLVTIRKSNPFYLDFIINIFPLILQYDINLSFKNKDSSDLGLSSLVFFPITNKKLDMNRLKNEIGLRYHISTNSKNIIEHKFILSYYKLY